MYECLKELHVPTIVCEQGHRAKHKRNLISEMSAFWGVKEKEGACGHSFDAVRLHQKNVHMSPPFIPFVLLDQALFSSSPLKQLGSLMADQTLLKTCV